MLVQRTLLPVGGDHLHTWVPPSFLVAGRQGSCPGTLFFLGVGLCRGGRPGHADSAVSSDTCAVVMVVVNGGRALRCAVRYFRVLS